MIRILIYTLICLSLLIPNTRARNIRHKKDGTKISFDHKILSSLNTGNEFQMHANADDVSNSLEIYNSLEDLDIQSNAENEVDKEKKKKSKGIDGDDKPHMVPLSFVSDTSEKKKSKGNGDDKPHMVPLSFVADASSIGVTFDAERSGILLHEYYDAVFQMYPYLKTRLELETEVLRHRDPLVEKGNPYSDEIAINSYVQSFSRGEGNNTDETRSNVLKLLIPLKENEPFTLDKDEYDEFTKTTQPPLEFRPFNEDNNDSDYDNEDNEDYEDDESESENK